MNDRARRASPLWEGGNVVTKGGIVNLVDEDAEESSGLVIGVQLEVRVNFDDECRSDGGE